jgi:hypothetical protein
MGNVEEAAEPSEYRLKIQDRGIGLVQEPHGSLPSRLFIGIYSKTSVFLE